RHLQGELQPAGEQRGGGGGGRAAHLDRGDALVRRLIEHGGQLLTPVREAGPGEVGVARRVRLPAEFETPANVVGGRGVRDAALRDAPQRRGGGVGGRRLGPPRDDRGVGQ